jgi:hypothetical protein
MPRESQTYLGDGAYAEFEHGSRLIIYTSNGISRTNEVVLERPEWLRLQQFAAAHFKEAGAGAKS